MTLKTMTSILTRPWKPISKSEMERRGGPKFTFHFLPSKQFDSLENRDARDCLLKWSMLNRIKVQAFSFDQTFQAYQKEEFILAFLQDPLVFHNLQIISSSGKWMPLGLQVKHVVIEDVACSLTSMTFFDRLHNDEVVRSGMGHVVRCFEEHCEEIPELLIDDELKKMLLVEDSPNFDMFSSSERQEFLFLLFRHFCIGGSLCQFEDTVEPYLTMTRSLYKDLIGVQKDSKSGQPVVNTFIYKVTAKDDGGGPVYPSSENHPQDFAYLCVNPVKKHVYVLYHRFGVSLPEIQ